MSLDLAEIVEKVLVAAITGFATAFFAWGVWVTKSILKHNQKCKHTFDAAFTKIRRLENGSQSSDGPESKETVDE